MNKFFDFRANSIDGETFEMSRYQGKVVLIVNTASKCGFTPQYTGLQALHDRYHLTGLEILGFPCDQFGKQEPGDAETIKNFCADKYAVSFQLFEKTEVNGKNAHPIYKYLKQELRGSLGRPIRWNFTKFLLDREGKPIKRFAPNTTPESIESHIVRLLDTPKIAGVKKLLL